MPYIPALDGIRTLAVAAVVLYHLNPSLVPGGMQGVTVFFVLSGYLITRLLLSEHKGTGRIDLKGFWQRRLRRLVPAIVTVRQTRRVHLTSRFLNSIGYPSAL